MTMTLKHLKAMKSAEAKLIAQGVLSVHPSWQEDDLWEQMMRGYREARSKQLRKASSTKSEP